MTECTRDLYMDDAEEADWTVVDTVPLRVRQRGVAWNIWMAAPSNVPPECVMVG